ncbi:hypothetical protein [Flavobacterium aquicola]|uniref:Uncharacterized protein n=1 Tax=Flavobacterium aquicola TaxID=1682742 RepID=A0A3E0DVV4_9FLAO|nr:hypothetical protein [Flavobacterium aquicola]REG88762.1 hypothetical protein C8P67_1282 [Flavobacterium aquicola]
MEITLSLMNDFEKRNNISTTIEINGDGSGNLREFWDEEIIKEFDSLKSLNLFLLNGKLKLGEDGRSVSPIEIVAQ